MQLLKIMLTVRGGMGLSIMTIILMTIGILLFISLVVIHELGHFLAARRGGVDVEEFGIGFPPQAWKKHIQSPKGNYVFSLNWLPLGGFVRLKGEHDDATESGSLGAAPLFTKVKIMVAGVGMNLLAAFILFTLVAWAGMPRLPEFAVENQFTVASDERLVAEARDMDVVLVGLVVEDSPAAAAGLAAGDELVAIDGERINDAARVSELTRQRAGETVSLLIAPADEQPQVEKSIILNEAEAAETEGYLGVIPVSGQQGFTTVRYTWSAPIVAAGTMAQFTQLTFVGLGNALGGLWQYIASFASGDEQAREAGQMQATQQVTGPVGIVATLFAVSQEGFWLMLFIIALISLALAIMNILPIPALDGGRLFVTLIFHALRKPLHKNIEERIHATGFMLLIGLFIVITIVDIRRFF